MDDKIREFADDVIRVIAIVGLTDPELVTRLPREELRAAAAECLLAARADARKRQARRAEPVA